jgi:hypothetical protein
MTLHNLYLCAIDLTAANTYDGDATVSAGQLDAQLPKREKLVESAVDEFLASFVLAFDR